MYFDGTATERQAWMSAKRKERGVIAFRVYISTEDRDTLREVAKALGKTLSELIAHWAESARVKNLAGKVAAPAISIQAGSPLVDEKEIGNER